MGGPATRSEGFTELLLAIRVRKWRALVHHGADSRTRAVIDTGAVIAQLRATDERSGGRREAWREPWFAERQRLDELARAASPAVLIERDAFVNTWYVLPGESDEAVLVHSHSDCVPGGGWLDGILGVHAGLGVLAGLAGESRRRRTVAVVDWADEEGTRFGRSLLGSSAAVGSLSVEEFGGLTAQDGTPAREVVSDYGFDAAALGTPSSRLAHVVAAAELHIEQGPWLARDGRSVAAVTGCLGVRRRRITFAGTAGHAGALPMADRHDPVRAAAPFIAAICRHAEEAGGLATVGRLQADPMISGPLHDSAALAQSGISTVMLFVPSIDGVSHTRAEDTREADLAAGIMALDALVGRLADG